MKFAACIYCCKLVSAEKNFCNSHCQELYDIKTGKYISIWKDGKSPKATKENEVKDV